MDISILSLLQAGPGSTGPALIALGLAIGIFVMAMRARRRRQVRDLLFRDVLITDDAGDGPPLAPESEENVRGLENWLSTAGYAGSNARFQFILWCAAAALLGGFTALLVDASGASERAIVWLEEIPGGVAEILAPVMRIATWLIALLITMLPVLWVRREEAIQKAQTLPTKLAFPLVICFLPGVFVWTFGPAVAEFVDLASSVLAERP